MPPSSAWTRARTTIIRPPITQLIITDGPATASASCGPNSHPEPMIDPTDAQVRPISPTWRLRAKSRFLPVVDGCVSTDVCRPCVPQAPPTGPIPAPGHSYPRWGQPETSTVLGDRTRKGGSNAWLSGPMDSA